jgi:hypothetical protein
MVTVFVGHGDNAEVLTFHSKYQYFIFIFIIFFWQKGTRRIKMSHKYEKKSQ